MKEEIQTSWNFCGIYYIKTNGNLTNNSSVRKAKQNRLIILSDCAVCGKKKSTFIENKKINNISNDFFFLSGFFFNEHSRITGLQGKGEDISLTPHYHFHLLHRHLDISRAITAKSSTLHIASSWTRTGNIWFPSASR